MKTKRREAQLQAGVLQRDLIEKSATVSGRNNLTNSKDQKVSFARETRLPSSGSTSGHFTHFL
jgi:hypothetical protein